MADFLKNMKKEKHIKVKIALFKDAAAFRQNWQQFPPRLLAKLVRELGVTHITLKDLFVAEGPKPPRDMSQLILTGCPGCGALVTMP